MFVPWLAVKLKWIKSKEVKIGTVSWGSAMLTWSGAWCIRYISCQIWRLCLQSTGSWILIGTVDNNLWKLNIMPITHGVGPVTSPSWWGKLHLELSEWPDKDLGVWCGHRVSAQLMVGCVGDNSSASADNPRIMRRWHMVSIISFSFGCQTARTWNMDRFTFPSRFSRCPFMKVNNCQCWMTYIYIKYMS